MKRPHPETQLAPGSLGGHRRGKRPAERGLEGRVPSTEELTRRASAQELLAQCLCSRLLLEKEESKRFEDRLQQWLSEDSGAFAESASLPLYLPQTLVSLPPAVGRVVKTRATPSPQVRGEGVWRLC